MEGYHGPLEITDIVELVDKTKYRPGIRFISSRQGLRAGAPAETCTMLVGAYLTNTYGHLAEDHQTAYNISTPFIPEYTVYDHKTGRIIARGWRSLIHDMVSSRVIRPDKHVEKLLGTKECDELRHAARIMA